MTDTPVSLIGFLQEKSMIDGRATLMPIGAITAYIKAYCQLPDAVQRVAAAIYPEYMEWIGVPDETQPWGYAFDSHKGPCICMAEAAIAALLEGK